MAMTRVGPVIEAVLVDQIPAEIGDRVQIRKQVPFRRLGAGTNSGRTPGSVASATVQRQPSSPGLQAGSQRAQSGSLVPGSGR
jgi:hypothetical protein